MSIIEKLAKKVQNYSGETERRELVEDFNLSLDSHMANIHAKVTKLNNVIKKYNKLIDLLNVVRFINFNQNLTNLHQFLSSYGQLKSRDAYINEQAKDIYSLPQQAFKNEEEYLDEIHLTKDEIFHSSFKKGIFGTKKNNRDKNLEMRSVIGDYKLKFDGQKHALQIDLDNMVVQQDIAQLYKDTVQNVSNVIERKIIPELNLAQAFLEAEEIKNHLISNSEVPKQLQEFNIHNLKDTNYHHHYQFVKNTFLYYILSEKIYSTPVLTKLFHKQGGKQDLITIQKQQTQMYAQEQQLQTIDAALRKGGAKA